MNSTGMNFTDPGWQAGINNYAVTLGLARNRLKYQVH